MGISTATQNAILKLIFNATSWSLYADNTATTPLTNLSVALHTADPGIGGTQATSEIAYTSYARVSVARTTGGWTASTAGSTSPVANIVFPTGTGGAGTATFFSVGATGGGATAILWSGTVTPNVVCGNTITPSLTTATTLTLV